MNKKSKVKPKNKSSKVDIKFNVDDLISVVMELYPDSHGIVIFREDGVEIITETVEFRKVLEKAFDGRILKSKEENINTFYQ